jgi:hypothetical protein
MPVSARGDLEADGHRILDIHWTWGMDFPPERRWTDGWGIAIEVPAVIELLDLVSQGRIDPSSARQALADFAAQLDAAYDPEHGNAEAQKYARCFGDCDVCQAAEPGYRRIAAETQARIAKALDTENYPYIINGSTAHLATCSHAAPHRWQAQAPSEQDFRRRLQMYAHREGIVEYQGEPVDWDGLVRWTQANVGPKGGIRYKACKVCRPHLP